MKTRVKLSFHLILTLVAMLTMAQTAWAAEQTVTWPMDGTGNSTDTRYDSEGKKTMTLSLYTWINGRGGRTSIHNNSGNVELGKNNVEISFPDIKGNITNITLNNISFSDQDGGKLCLYAGKDMDHLLKTEDNQDGHLSATQGSAQRNLSFTGSIDVSDGEPLKLMFRYAPNITSSDYDFFSFANGSIVVTYTPEAQQDAGHRFSYSISTDGASLTAECTANHTCDIPNRKATVTLDIEDTQLGEFQSNPYKFDISEFKRVTGLEPACSAVTYTSKKTGQPANEVNIEEGSYTASVTITIDETAYTLNKDIDFYTGKAINNSYRQISLSKNVANKHDIITITFTPRSHELVNTLTVTGATTDMSIGNGVTKVDEYTYTFTMPYDEVTIGATFKSSNASLYKYAIGTDITGSGAVDYNAEEYLGVGDVITITFMPYLQGNLEAGSVVLEGLTVTGATTNMSVGNGITDNGDNTYTFTMPGENVTVTAKAYLSADAILAGTINEPIYIKQGNGIQIGCNNIWTYVNDGALPLVIPDGNTLRLAGGTDVRLDLADKNAIACEGDAIVELIPNEVSNEIWIGDRPERNSGKATIKVGPAGKTLTIRVADESTETVHLSVKSISQYDRNCDVIGCDEVGSCGSIVVESGQVESRVYFNHSGRAFRTTDGTITFGYKYPDDKIIFDGGSEGTVKIEDGKQFHSYYDNNTKYSGTINLQGINSFYARPDKYTVNYCEHDGQNQKVRYVAHGMPFSFKAATPADEGHEFQGWKNMVTDEVYEHDFIVTNDLNIIAQWKAVDFQKKGNLAKASEEDEAFYWSTFYCGDATYQLGEKACAYTATYDGGQIVLHKLGTVIPADKAVVIASENELTGMTVVAGDTPAEYEVENDLKGYDYRYYVDAQNSSVAYYVLGKYKNAEDGVEFGFQRYQGDYLPAHKAFLNAGGAANARGLGMVFAAEDITGIENLNMNVSERNDTWYTLDGRKLDKKPTTRGIYINRGNKFVIK